MKVKKLILLVLLTSSFIFAQTPNLKKVSLQLQWKHQFEFAGFYIAKEKGFYKDVGLDVQIKEFDSNINIVDEVLSKNATFGTNYPSLILEKSKGKDIVLLSAILQSSPHALISLESSGINSLKDFKNKALMIDKSAVNVAPFVSMFKSHNISFDEIKKVPQTFNIDDLINKKVDIATIFTTNEPFYLDKKNIKYKIWDPKNYGFDFYDVLLFTSNSVLKDNPKMVEDFRSASLRGWEYAFSNIDETVDLIFEKYNTQNRTKEALKYEAKELKKLAYYKNSKIGNINFDSIQRIYDIYNLLGLTINNIDLEKFIYKPSSHVEIFTQEEKEYLNNNSFNIYINNWSPISIYDNKTKKFDGLSIDYWNKINELIPIESNLIYTGGFLNSINKLKNDKNGVMISLSYTKDRASYGSFSKPYVSYPIGIATKDNKNFILDFTELEGKRIAVGKNYSAHKLLQKYYPKIKFVPVKNTLEALELLSRNEVYGVADVLFTLKFYLQEYVFQNLKIAGSSDFKFDIRIMVNKENSKLIPIINKAIDKISGDEKRLFQNKWLQTIKEVEKTNYTMFYILLAVFILIVLFLLWRHKELSKYKNALEIKTKQLNDYVEASTDFVWEVDKNGIYTKVSSKVEEILGYKVKEIIGKTPFDFMSKDEKSRVLLEFSELLSKRKPIKNLKNWNMHKNGSTVLLLTNGVPIYSNNEFLGYRGTDKDITKEKQQDLIILEQSKMVAMGEMIANIAHQWRQPLSVISTSATAVITQKEFGVFNDKDLIKYCTSINEQAQYLSKTIDIFRNFLSEKKVLKVHPIEDEVKNAVSIVKSSLKNKYIKLIDNIDYSKEHNVDIVVNELSQVIINIINNSKDIIIQRDIANGYIEINLKNESDKILLTIEDNGKGIEESVLPHIFEPYFTTKHQSQGTGLGLHMSYKIVTESCNGKIYADNTTAGAKFFIEIPIK